MIAIDCWCMTCDAMLNDALEMNGDHTAWMFPRFIVCPDCGNKRCPKAAHHDRGCTRSNDVGQPESAWEHVK